MCDRERTGRGNRQSHFTRGTDVKFRVLTVSVDRCLLLGAVLALGVTMSAANSTPAADEVDLGQMRIDAEQGDARAMDVLGNAYWRGRGVPMDMALAEDYLRRAVDAGRDQTRVNLARLLAEEGRGREALATFEEAVALDVRLAEYWLARGHVRGDFGALSTPDVGRADLERMASEGNDRAAYALANALDGGAAIEPDPARAVALYQSLADAGDPRAIAQLGYLTWRGIGTDPDLVQAAAYLQDAIAAGNDKATINLSRVLVAKGENGRALEILTEAAADGLEEADYWLARLHARQDFGRLSDQDFGRAQLDRLSAAGHVPATVDLAGLAGDSNGGPIDPVEIAARLEVASDGGSARATAGLLRLIRERRDAFPDGVARRKQILAEMADRLPAERRLPEEIWLAADQTSGRERYRTVSQQLAGSSGEAFRRALRAAYSADRRAYTWVLQERLAERGYYRGNISGLMTASTIRAFRRFCRQNDIDRICRQGPLRSDTVNAIAPFL